MNKDLAELNNLLSEAERRQTSKFKTYKPLPHQEDFHKSKSWVRMIFGGNRSGKSRANAQEILWWCTNKHPYQVTSGAPRIWVIAPEYRVIYEGIWLHLVNTLPDWEVKKWGPRIPNWDIRTYLEFRSGARIDFISAEGGEADRKKLQAAEIDYACIDEELQGDLWTEIKMRLLTRGGRVTISATLVNSEDWLLELEDKAKSGDERYHLSRLDTQENPYNNKEILKAIMDEMSTEEQEVRILGRSRKRKGVIYSNWSKANEIPPFDIPSQWPRGMVFDPGARVAAALWIAISPKGYHFCYREMYLRHAELKDCVLFWKESEGYRLIKGKWVTPGIKENILWRIIDPHAYDTQVDGSIGTGNQLAVDYGYDFIPAINSKSQNIEDFRRLLLPSEDPRFKIFNTLENFKRERRNYRIRADRSRKNVDAPKARPLKKDDHLMNCIEYWASQHYCFIAGETPERQLEREAKLDDSVIEMPEDLTERRNKILKIARIRQKKRYGRERFYPT